MSVIKRCGNPVEHRPITKVTQQHHVIPISWGGLNGEKIPLCGSCHDTEHEILNHFVRAQGRPPWTIIRGYSPFLVDLAQRAWDECQQARRPFTGTIGEHGGDPDAEG